MRKTQKEKMWNKGIHTGYEMHVREIQQNIERFKSQ